jgi:prepilin-type N-terminal cleavage/methylation domain-containing protein
MEVITGGLVTISSFRFRSRSSGFSVLEILIALAVIAVVLSFSSLNTEYLTSRLTNTGQHERLQIILDEAFFQAVVHPDRPVHSIPLTQCVPNEVVVVPGGLYRATRIRCHGEIYDLSEQGVLSVSTD